MRNPDRILPAREMALKLLSKVENSDAFINILLDRTYSGKNYNPGDKGLITEIVYGVTRRKIELDFIIDRLIKKRAGKLPNMIRQILRIGIYQLKYLDRVPSYSAVDESVKLAKRYGHPGTVKLVNAVLRNFSSETRDYSLKKPDLSDMKSSSVYYSMSEFIIEKWINVFGREKTLSILVSLNYPPAISIRVNRLITDRDKLVAMLSDYEPRKSSLSKDGLLLEKAEGLVDSEIFEKGYFMFQDDASQIICEALDPQKGELILDACAAPGSKTTHISQATGDNCRVIACDSNFKRLLLLKDNCSRLHISSVLPVCCDLQHYKFEDSCFDRILLDAPCSCTGLFRRHPELKYKISSDKITGLSDVQLQILLNISRFLKKGGIIVYSTCSLEREENEKVIGKFLQMNRSFRIMRCEKIEDRIKPDVSGIYRIFPDDFSTDGFSFVILKGSGE